MRDSDSNKLRPIDAFVKYFLDVKPYHTKLLEVVERYKFAETLHADIADTVHTTVAYRNTPLCKEVGFGLVFDDCGFSNDNCCDLFQCLSGYGLIWDNSDLIGIHDIAEIDFSTDEIIVSGNYTFDQRLEILNVGETSLTLRGDRTAEFMFHKMFLIAPFNVYSIAGAYDNVLEIVGDASIELNLKREIKVNGTSGRDGRYGIAAAVYDATREMTIITVSGNANFNVGVDDAYIETETQSRNQGFYAVDHAELSDGNTIVHLNAGSSFPQRTTANNGSLQLRTALSAPRRVWLSNGEMDREYRVADAFYDVTNDRTHIVLADRLFEGETYHELRLYGYMTSSGFDNDEECDQPKPTNIHAAIGESLKITMRKGGTFSTAFDYAVLRYKWTDANGRDMDTRTAVSVPGIYEDVGWSRSSATPHLSWAADNTGSTGSEGILIDFKTLKQDYPGLSFFEIRLRNFWYNTVVDGFYDVEFTMYRGGEMVVSGTDWENYGGIAISTITRRGRNYTRVSSDIDGDDVGYLSFDTLNNTGSLVIYPLPSAPAVVSPTPAASLAATPSSTPTPTPTKTPATSAPFYEKYMYFTNEISTGTGMEVSVGYGKVTGASGVELLASHVADLPGWYRANQSTVYNDVIYVAHGTHVSVYKYANNTLEEVQVIPAPDPTGFTLSGGGTLNVTTITGLNINQTTGDIYLTADLARTFSGLQSKTVLLRGTVGGDGLITLVEGSITPVVEYVSVSGNATFNTSYIHINENMLVCSVMQDTYPDTNQQGLHSLFLMAGDGTLTFVGSTASAAATSGSKVYGHENAVFDRAQNAMWSYPFTVDGFGATGHGGFISGIGGSLLSDTLVTLPDGKVRAIGHANSSSSIVCIDKNLVDGSDTGQFTSTYTVDGRGANYYGHVKYDDVNKRVIIFDSAQTRESPTKASPYAIADFTQQVAPSSITGISSADNVIPLRGAVTHIQLLDVPLATFAITPTPTPTSTATPTPTPTNTVTPTPSPSFGAAQPYVTAVQTGLLGSTGLTPIVQDASVDDSSYQITLPFNFQFFGNDYGVGNNGGIFVGTNSYLTVGVGSNLYSSLNATRPGKGILIAARDVRILSLYSGLQDGGASYRIRYEGNDWYEQNTMNFSWEMTFYQNSNLVQLVTGPRLGTASSGAGTSGISDGVTFQPAITFQPSKSYVLQSDATGTNWTITEGSVNIIGRATPTPSVTGTLTPTPTPTITISSTTTPTPTPSVTLTPTPTATPVYGNSIYNKIVAWWEFEEEDSYARYVDSHGGHVMALTGPSSAFRSLDSKIGKAAKIPSRGNAMYVPRSDTTFDFTTDCMSFAGWTKIDANHDYPYFYPHIIGRSSGGSVNVGYESHAYTPDGTKPTLYRTSGTPASYNQMYKDQWHFFHIWNDPQGTNTSGSRIDLQASSPVAASTLAHHVMNNLSFGAEVANDAVDTSTWAHQRYGLLSYDSIACFSQPLTEQEYRWLYNAGQGRTYAEVRGIALIPSALTPTPTVTATVTPTVTPTLTPTPTPTISITPTPTITPTLSITPTPSVALTPFGLADDGYVAPEGDVDVDF